MGETPYFGLAIDEIQPKLLTGYRRPRPESCVDVTVLLLLRLITDRSCSTELYEAMIRCWDVDPRMRWKLVVLL